MINVPRYILAAAAINGALIVKFEEIFTVSLACFLVRENGSDVFNNLFMSWKGCEGK
jgi:hypothetical protein